MNAFGTGLSRDFVRTATSINQMNCANTYNSVGAKALNEMMADN